VQSASWVSNSGGNTTINLYGRLEDGGSIYVRNIYKYAKAKKNFKAITLQTWTGLVGSRSLKLPEVLDQASATYGARAKRGTWNDFQ